MCALLTVPPALLSRTPCHLCAGLSPCHSYEETRPPNIHIRVALIPLFLIWSHYPAAPLDWSRLLARGSWCLTHGGCQNPTKLDYFKLCFLSCCRTGANSVLSKHRSKRQGRRVGSCLAVTMLYDMESHNTDHSCLWQNVTAALSVWTWKQVSFTCCMYPFFQLVLTSVFI